jgi:hypothetical protein
MSDPVDWRQVAWDAQSDAFAICAKLLLAEAKLEKAREALEAADSIVKSYERAALEGWEVDLYKRRRAAMEARDE